MDVSKDSLPLSARRATAHPTSLVLESTVKHRAWITLPRRDRVVICSCLYSLLRVLLRGHIFLLTATSAMYHVRGQRPRLGDKSC